MGRMCRQGCAGGLSMVYVCVASCTTCLTGRCWADEKDVHAQIEGVGTCWLSMIPGGMVCAALLLAAWADGKILSLGEETGKRDSTLLT